MVVAGEALSIYQQGDKNRVRFIHKERKITDFREE